MRYVLGIDGGNSKTLAVLCDVRGSILGVGRGGGSNHQTSGLERSMDTIRAVSEQAITSAGIDGAAVDVLSCGLAGADLPEDFELLRPRLAQLGTGRRVELRNDSLVGLRAGTQESWGVVLICGSGFNVAGRAPDGREIVFPALGWISGDSGGGGAIAREMVRLVMRADDGRGKPTALTQMVLEALGSASPFELMLELYHERIEPDRVLHLVPLLFEAAERGDAVAQDLIIGTGEELAVAASAAIRRLELQSLPVQVVLSGGVFMGRGPLLLDTIRQQVHRTAPGAKLVSLQFEPVIGAVLLGLESGGVQPDEALYSRLHETMPESLRLPLFRPHPS